MTTDAVAGSERTLFQNGLRFLGWMLAAAVIFVISLASIYFTDLPDFIPAVAIALFVSCMFFLFDRSRPWPWKRLGGATTPFLFAVIFWLVAIPQYREFMDSMGDSTLASFEDIRPFINPVVTGVILFCVPIALMPGLQDRQRRLVDALFLIVITFAIAAQVRAGIESRNALVQRNERLVKLDRSPEPVPSVWTMIWEQENYFLSVDSFRATANQSVVVGIAAMGMTIIIISGGIDLSVGSVIALTCVATALGLREGYSPWTSMGIGVAAGGTCGLLNAVMITRLKVVPFIATLGMWGMARGLAKGLADEQKIDAMSPDWMGDVLSVQGQIAPWMPISYGLLVMTLLAMVVAFMLRYTSFGRYVFAIGSNEATARLCGIKVNRVKLYVYSLAGLATGLAGVMQFCRLNVGDPTTAQGAELDVIAAVVIGGGSLNGGQGSVLGSLIGAFIMQVLRVGCVHVGIPSWVQEMVIGAVIVLAVALDYLRRRGRA